MSYRRTRRRKVYMYPTCVETGSSPQNHVKFAVAAVSHYGCRSHDGRQGERCHRLHVAVERRSEPDPTLGFQISRAVPLHPTTTTTTYTTCTVQFTLCTVRNESATAAPSTRAIITEVSSRLPAVSASSLPYQTINRSSYCALPSPQLDLPIGAFFATTPTHPMSRDCTHTLLAPCYTRPDPLESRP